MQEMLLKVQDGSFCPGNQSSQAKKLRYFSTMLDVEWIIVFIPVLFLNYSYIMSKCFYTKHSNRAATADYFHYWLICSISCLVWKTKWKCRKCLYQLSRSPWGYLQITFFPTSTPKPNDIQFTWYNTEKMHIWNARQCLPDKWIKAGLFNSMYAKLYCDSSTGREQL